MGVVGDAKAKKPVAGSWPPYTPHSTSYIPNKQPPSGGYAAFSPKGEVLFKALSDENEAATML